MAGRKQLPLRLTSAERAELLTFYKKALKRIADSIDRNVWSNPANPRHLALLAETKLILTDLDAKAGRWAERHVNTLYGGNVRFVNDSIRAASVVAEEIERARVFAKIHRDSIRDLILNPTTGITPRLQAASEQMGKSIGSFVSSNKVLLQQTKLLSDAVAQNILMGTGSGQARDQVLSALLNSSSPPESFLGLNPLVSGAKSLMDAPYLKIPLKAGGTRRIHIFDHVQMTTATMESRVRTQARNNRMAQVGIRLAQISPNPPLTPCVCSLYAGRIVALDQEAERLTGYPWIGRLPNGGPPFHPHCTHTTIPFVEEMVDDQTKLDAEDNPTGTPTFGGKGMPVGVLNKDFTGASRYFRSKGGIQFAAKQNPQIKKFRPHRNATPEVKDALDISKQTPKDPSDRASDTFE